MILFTEFEMNDHKSQGFMKLGFVFIFDDDTKEKREIEVKFGENNHSLANKFKKLSHSIHKMKKG